MCSLNSFFQLMYDLTIVMNHLAFTWKTGIFREVFYSKKLNSNETTDFYKNLCNCEAMRSLKRPTEILIKKIQYLISGCLCQAHSDVCLNKNKKPINQIKFYGITNFCAHNFLFFFFLITPLFILTEFLHNSTLNYWLSRVNNSPSKVIEVSELK